MPVFRLREIFLLGLCLVVSLLMSCADDSSFCTGEECGIVGSACDPACESGYSCVAGECVVRGASCAQAGDSCLPENAQASGFVCMDWSATGSAICSSNCAMTGECESGSQCFALHSYQDASCQADADCADGKACLAGVCRFAACQPSDCSGPVDGQAECDERFAGHPDFPYGARCAAAGNQAHFCQPAGARGVGDDCVAPEVAAETQNYPATCAAGLSCVNATCLQGCTNNDECDAPETCVFEGGGSGGGSVIGFCADACTPFEAGACASDQMCEPLTHEVGQCVPAGPKDVGSRCAPGAGQCAAGTLCVAFPEAGGEARCQPICDLAPAATGDDGSIAPGAQAARDATCPQPESAPASLRVAHLAEALGPVDVYLDGASDPLVAGLDYDASYPGAEAADDAAWHALPGGRYRLRALPAGAPRSELPLAEFTLTLSAGQGKTALLADAQPSASKDAEFLALAAPFAEARSAAIDIRLAHLIADLGAIDVVLSPADADASDLSAHTLLAQGLRRGDAHPADGSTVALSAEDASAPLKLIAFPAGADRGDPADTLFETGGFSLTEDVTLILNGTLDAGDAGPTNRVALLPMGEAAPTSAAGARFTCVELEARSFGVCQQMCAGGVDDYGSGVCQGERMGCAPSFLANRQQWKNLCAPVGLGDVDAACDPYIEHGECLEGLYCQPIGASEAGMSLPSGRCAPLCDVDAPHSTSQTTSRLGCEDEQACQALEPGSSFKLGQCGWACTPGRDYRDTSCPEGLDRCEPNATLRDDLAGQITPQIHHEQPFCAAAGPRQPGEQCNGGDCAAGSECLYPRSIQGDFTSTLASPYFGAPGLVPVCMPACDPFDGDSAAHHCAIGETCLFNAWNAEVGHCAPIVEDLAPLERCEQPGLACGDDSICALSQGTPTCLRFCDYLGADAQGAYLQSTCPADLRCEPLINDIGICQAS